MSIEKLTEERIEELGLDLPGDAPGWYIHDPNNTTKCYQWVGPYNTKAEATEDKRGLERFWREHALD